MEDSSKTFAIIAFGTATYMGWVASKRMNNYYELDKIDRLEDLLTASSIYQRLVNFEFPFIGTKALEFGLFKTYAIPSISKILVSTGELTERVEKRYDDTDLLVREFSSNYPHNWRAELAIRRLNALHGKYPISNIDYLYVLTIFAVEPIRWIDKYGFRRSHPIEKQCSFWVWRDIGEKMGIKAIPNSYENMELYLQYYEEKYMKYNKTNSQVADATIQLLLSKLPKFLHSFGHYIVYAMCDERLRKAMDFPKPMFLLPETLNIILKLSGWFTYFFIPIRIHSAARTCSHKDDKSKEPIMGLRLCPLFHPYAKTYEKGYIIEEMGPVKYLEDRELGVLHQPTATKSEE